MPQAGGRAEGSGLAAGSSLVDIKADELTQLALARLLET